MKLRKRLGQVLRIMSQLFDTKLVDKATNQLLKQTLKKMNGELNMQEAVRSLNASQKAKIENGLM